MCRWLAYTGDPVLLDELLYKPKHSLIVQSLHSTAGRGDHQRGRLRRGLVRRPAHARRLPRHRTRLERPQPAGAGHARGLPAGLRPHPRLQRLRGPADELPSLPARPLALDAQRAPAGLRAVKRDLALAVDPELYPHIEGSTDSSCCSSWHSRSGWRTTRAVERAVGLVEATGRRHGWSTRSR